MRARALVALLVVGCIAVADRMGEADPTWTIESALRSSGLAHSRTAGGAFVVIFAATHARDVETWPVTVRSVAGGDWVLVFATLLRADPGKLDEDVLKEALLHNSRTAGGKLALDAETGDLDVQYEIPSVALTPELLRLIINDVAATCDAQYRPFRDLVD
jgi:hypothetical protein